MSHQIPDPIEPAFLKNKSDAIIEDYTNAALQLKEDPMLAVELMAQSMSDTVEEEGVMYVSGSALTYLIPSSLFVKFIKEGSTVKGVGKGRVGGDNKETKGNRLITSVDDLSDTAKSKISTSQRASLNQQDRTYLHLTEMDLKGAQRDLDGNPVPKPGGGYYDHAQEVSDAYRSLSDLKKSWEGVLKNPNLDAELRQLYTSKLTEVNVTMKKVDDMFAPYGGVNPPK
ncbi:polymorphic toxin type 28 domain-containing protein [Pseudogracilibacillus sp. SO30301A]|uniref:polymorphic toxin type 28 domain-containing protein n=1 Tax=Pseudogracilibacillus sp. SO30301A TaxID=3098291 RepID=UPI00300E4FF4